MTSFHCICVFLNPNVTAFQNQCRFAGNYHYYITELCLFSVYFILFFKKGIISYRILTGPHTLSMLAPGIL